MYGIVLFTCYEIMIWAMEKLTIMGYVYGIVIQKVDMMKESDCVRSYGLEVVISKF